MTNFLLNGVQRDCQLRDGLALRNRFLGSRVAPFHDDIAAGDVARAEFEDHGHAQALPVEELRSGADPFAGIDMSADIAGELGCDIHHLRAFGFLPINRHEDRLARRDFRRQHKALVVGMRHDQSADQARADAPAGLPDIIERAFPGLELNIEGLSKILAQVVTGAGLQRHAVLHHGFHGERFQGTREFLRLRFYAFKWAV
jgi:hypothetical protein